ncbi:hypothetical protein IG631_02828 [Alternaria alternata]|nr:hypothetical protein IG631_02828 [Alternaria alternata]
MLGMLKDGEGYCGLLEDSIDSKVDGWIVPKHSAIIHRVCNPGAGGDSLTRPEVFAGRHPAFVGHVRADGSSILQQRNFRVYQMLGCDVYV